MLNESLHPVSATRSVACELYHRAEEMDVRLDYLVEELTRLTNMMDRRVFSKPVDPEPAKIAGNPERLGILADLDSMSRSHIKSWIKRSSCSTASPTWWNNTCSYNLSRI